MKTIDAKQTKELLLAVADAVIDAKPMLTEVDSAVGDGDHGIGMEIGLKKAAAKLNATEPSDVYALFQLTGKTMLMSMGGASGVIFGSMFLAGAKGQEPSGTLSLPDFAALFTRSLAEIQKRGQASVGDKTMVDALSPAVDALNAHSGGEYAEALAAAEVAAKQGMEDTKKYEAKFGRSKTQSTTIGFQDAGATSVWVIFRAMHDYFEKPANS